MIFFLLTLVISVEHDRRIRIVICLILALIYIDLFDVQQTHFILLFILEHDDTYLASPQVDTDRIYVMGLSMGGMGTYDLAIRYPEIFAAAIPICGTVNPSRLRSAVNVAFRIFHGDKDNVVTVEGSRQAYKTLKELGANVAYIEFPGYGHDSWTPAYNYPGFMDWLFSQKKKD